MTPQFSQAVDPIFLYVLDLLDRIDGHFPLSVHDERIRLRALLDQAEAILGAGEQWDLAKYAIVSWIDEMMVKVEWPHREWWSNNVMEVELFNSRLCFEQFYIRAQQASSLTKRDALEVFYVCAVLGFRGLYADEQSAAMFAQQHGLPPTMAIWAKQTAMSIRLGQGRPALSAPGREVLGAPPLHRKSRSLWPWLAASILSVTALVFFFWSHI